MTHPWYKPAESEGVEAISRCGHVVTLRLSKFYRNDHHVRIRQQADRLCSACRLVANHAAAAEILALMKAPLPALSTDPHPNVERKGEWARSQVLGAIEKLCRLGPESGYFPENAVASFRRLIEKTDKNAWLRDWSWAGDAGYKYLARSNVDVPNPIQ
jgi:hypothetical protein